MGPPPPGFYTGLPIPSNRTMAIGYTISITVAVALSALFAFGASVAACVDDEISIHCGATPTSALSETGEILSVFVAAEHVWFTRAQRDALDFVPPVRITREPTRIDHNGESRPKIALGRDDAIFVSWTRRLEGHFSGDVYFSRSLDGGSTFSEPRVLRDTSEPSSHRFDTLAVTPSGRLYAAWVDKRDMAAAEARGDEFAGASIYFAVSDDDGATFSANQRVAAHSCECCRLAMTTVGDERIRLLWRHVFDGSIRDHALAEIGPSGVAPLERVSHENWALQGCPHQGPHMAAARDGEHMVWFSGAPDAGGLHYGFRDDATGDTVRRKRIDVRAGAGKPQVAARGDEVDLVWLAVSAEYTELLHMKSRDAGGSWSPVRAFAQSAGATDLPQLLSDGESLWVAWHTQDEGFRVLSLSTRSEPP
jgi:hypothetical protein